MYIVILGGENDEKGKLSDFTKKRIEKFYEVFEEYRELKPKTIISGGFRFSDISHCSLIKKQLLNKYPYLYIVREFIENNNTVDEAINMAEYFKNLQYKGNIIIITSNWHLERAKYLFDKTFEKLKNIKLIYINTIENEIRLTKEEQEKLCKLQTNSYGKWKNFLINK